MKAHDFTGRVCKKIPWPYCRGCGLLLLKNEATRRAARKPCPRDHEEGCRCKTCTWLREKFG